MNDLVLSVSQLNRYARNLLEQDPNLSNVFVVGEISNFTNHYRSGHWYFSLKDAEGVIGAVMFRSAAQRIRFAPQDGMRVICRGRVTIYDRDGRFQLYVDDMQPDGMGALNLAYEQLKEKLFKIGLFDESHKKPIPAFPQTIAVVTSPTGAALQDILNILSRRYPLATVKLCPVQVQGESAPAQLADAVNTLSVQGGADVIILGRGGGSLEDLWAFNSEELAFAIYNCPIPIISAVGHETDFTISDFVADLRAPTPSAAAELATPDIRDLKEAVGGYRMYMKNCLAKRLEREQALLDRLASSPRLTAPKTLLEPYSQRLDMAGHALTTAANHVLEKSTAAYENLSARLTAYSPLGVLGRGYAIARKNNAVIRSSEQLQVGESFEVIFSRGKVICTVDNKEE
jgi:exodeoxyribonuclease VII large subunit